MLKIYIITYLYIKFIEFKYLATLVWNEFILSFTFHKAPTNSDFDPEETRHVSKGNL